MVKAGTIFIFFILMLQGAFARSVSYRADTLIQLSEVSVTASRISIYNEDLKVITLDSSSRMEQSASSLGELLLLYTPLHLLQYGGQGSLTTLSLRGSTTSQTQVLWNGFPVNSPTTGIADLSGLRADIFDHISIVPGAPASLFGSGTAGGALSLSDRPANMRGLQGTVSLSAGSFHTFTGYSLFKAGNDKIQYSGKIFGEGTLNDFPYTDNLKPGAPQEINSHGKYRQSGTMHSVTLQQGNRNIFRGGFWMQKSFRQIPPVMGSYRESFQQQSDSLFRIYAGWENRAARRIWKIRTAYFSEGMRFTDRAGGADAPYSIDSHIRSASTMADASLQWALRENFMFDLGGSMLLTRAVADAYPDPVREVKGSLSGGVKYKTSRLVLNLTGRQGFYAEKSTPQVSAGLRYALNEDKIFFRYRFYTHYRIPALNDKYWTPGGNPDLKPEHGWGTNAGIEGIWQFMPHGNLSFTADVFMNSIKDQIFWVPGPGYWSPANIQYARMYGIEQTGTMKLSIGNLKAELRESYHFTRSVMVSNDVFPDYEGNTNPYIPAHTFSAALHLSNGKLYGTLFESVTSARYTTTDNSGWYLLDPFAITTVTSGMHYRPGNWELTIEGMIRNLFNTQYQFISARPVPGRSFRINMIINFNSMSH